MLLSGCYTVTPISNNSGNANGGGIFYALPFTQICVDVTYQYYDLSEAIFSQYASEMLALDNFDAERPYRIKDIQTSYNVTADPDHYYFITPNGISVQVDSRQLLRSIGLTPMEAASALASVATDTDTSNRPTPSDAKLVLHNAT